MVDLTIVVPCYNEEEVLPETIKQILALLRRLQDKVLISESSQVCFIDDGSMDRTWQLIEESASTCAQVHGIKLSRNRGHQNALLAGLMTVQGDVVVSIDADLQDDLDVIEEMLARHSEGCQIVYGTREERQSDTLFKRATAKAYYHLLNLMGVDVIMHHADYRLMARPALDALKEYGEVNVFLRGLMPTIGFPSATVTYSRQERFAGKSEYTLRKMLALAVDGITSFSALPLRVIAITGLLVFFCSLFLV